MKFLKYAVFMLITLGSIAASSLVSASEDSIRPGIIVNPIGSGLTLEYEHLLSKKIGVGARLATIDYKYEDGSYVENGKGNGIEFIVRFYPQGKGFDGFYVGAGVGIWDVEWDWTDPTGTPTAANGTSTAANVNLNLGWKIPLGSDKIYLDPAIMLGNYFSSASDDTEGFGFYAAAQLGVVFVF